MKFMSGAIALLFVVSFSTQAENNVPYEDLEIEWSPRETGLMLGGEEKNFLDATKINCGNNVQTENHPGQEKILTQFGAIAVEWIASSLVSAFKDRELRKIAEYSASYSNSPTYSKEFVFPGSGTQDMCVIARRTACTVDQSRVMNGTASCLDAKDKKTEFYIGILLHPEEGNRVRVLPYAWSLMHLKPKHSSGNAVVSVRFQLNGLSNDEKGGGKEWTSGQVGLVTFACPFKKDGSAYERPCEWHLQEKRIDWRLVPLLPLPPRTVAAPVFTIAEVGQPSRGLKLFAKFLEDKKDDISTALADAMKKKLDLGQ